MAWYSTGTVAVTLNSPTVTGTGTTFSANVRVGDAFKGPDGRWYEVTNVASSTVISIKPNYQGSTASGQAYAVAPILGYDKDLSDRFNLIANQWGATLAGIKPWALSANAAAARGISASAVRRYGRRLVVRARCTRETAFSAQSLRRAAYRLVRSLSAARMQMAITCDMPTERRCVGSTPALLIRRLMSHMEVCLPEPVRGRFLSPSLAAQP
ncbi:hypothetical protein ACVCGX_19700 [Pseudomonas aeruginosa]